jgi:hypothetical protein
VASLDIAGRWDEIKRLKREKRLDEAITLLEQEARDKEAEHRREGWYVATAAFHELQKLYRRQGRHADEVAILHRWKALPQDNRADVDTLIEEATRRAEVAAAGPVAVACPHCGVVLDPPPRGSRKCPDCRESIVVRTDPVTKEKLMLTSTDADEYDRAKQRDRDRRKVLRQLGGSFGVDDYDQIEAELRVKFGGAEPEPGDVFWSIACNLQLSQEANGMWEEAAGTWRKMANHLQDEGRDPTTALTKAFENILRYHAELTAPGSPSTADPFLDIRTHPDCEPCSVDEGRRVGVAEARQIMPLPHAGCADGFCRCSYRNVYGLTAYNSDGDLVLNRTEVVVKVPISRPARKKGLLRRLLG